VAAAAAAAVENHQPIPTPPKESLQDKVRKQLAQKQEAIKAAQSTEAVARHTTEVSPWLDATQWEEYLQGHDLGQAIQLITLPDGPLKAAIGKPDHHLLLFLESFDRLIEQAREALLTGRVNVFD
jgi:hypothetical protein